jgi:3-keto-L-gulonate-6-phosphate decarboxylase
MKKPWVQIAIDALNLERAKELTRIALDAGADWIEAGTPLIVYEGVRAIHELVKISEGRPVVADYKAQDGVAKYFKEAGRQGAKVATVLAFAPNGSIKAAVMGGKEGGVQVMADLFAVELSDIATRAREVETFGVDYFLIHLGHDQAKDEPDRTVLDGLDELAAAVNIPIGVSTFTKEEALEAVRRGASFIVQGEPILSAPDARENLSEFIEVVKKAGA